MYFYNSFYFRSGENGNYAGGPDEWLPCIRKQHIDEPLNLLFLLRHKPLKKNLWIKNLIREEQRYLTFCTLGGEKCLKPTLVKNV